MPPGPSCGLSSVEESRLSELPSVLPDFLKRPVAFPPQERETLRTSLDRESPLAEELLLVLGERSRSGAAPAPCHLGFFCPYMGPLMLRSIIGKGQVFRTMAGVGIEGKRDGT